MCLPEWELSKSIYTTKVAKDEIGNHELQVEWHWTRSVDSINARYV
jgi:hypothetical protein